MFNQKEINNKVRVYLIEKPRVGRFYLLPKIHKRASNVPGHPMISNNGTAMENISAFLDFHLKKQLQQYQIFQRTPKTSCNV